MLPLIPIAIGGGMLATGMTLNKLRKRTALVAELTNQQPADAPAPLRSVLQYLKDESMNRLIAADERYQGFVQKHIDPLLGKERHAQSLEMSRETALTLSEDERNANYFLAAGTSALGLSLLGQWGLAPLMPVAIVMGLAFASMNFHYAWQQWKETKRFGNMHLLCIYAPVMWLGGYAIVGAAGMVLMAVSLKVKAIAENQSRNNLVDIFHLQPSKVWVRSNDHEIEIPFAQLQIGDILLVQAGQIVPVDGTIVAGVATVDQHMLTGEAQPVEKSIEDDIFASTVLISGKIDVRVEKTGTETTAGQIGEILNQSAQYNTTTALNGITTADRFALPTLALSIASWPVIGAAGAVSLMGANSMINAYFTSPLAILNFLNLAASGGVLVKDGSALEQLNDIDTIVFDKTGTLTIEQPHVAHIHTFNGMDMNDVLRLAAAAEARQTHPIARAILDAAAVLDLELPAIDEAHYEVGYGLKVRLVEDDRMTRWPDDKMRDDVTEVHQSNATPLIRVGSGRFMTMEGVELPDEIETLTDACQAQGHSLVMVAVDDKLVGSIELQPTVRPEVQEIIAGLQGRGLDLYIISGDQEAPTRKLATDLGMTGYFANTLPEAKADLVEQLQAEGRQVCFIGDGINDAIAMRKANVSISLQGATTAATDTAQVILMEGNLSQLLYLFKLSEEFTLNLKRNFRFTAGVSLVAVSGILLAGFTFAATEVFYVVSLLGGLGIAMKPLLDHQKSGNLSAPIAE